jgi:AcrR family transcriptional regulator
VTDREHYHHGDLRRALVDQAYAVVRDKGASAFSLRAAARALGVDVAAAYRHFRNKDAILAEVASRGFTDLARRMEQAQQGRQDEVSRFRATGEAYVAFAVAEPELFRVALGRRDRTHDARGAGDSGLDPYELFLAALGDLHATGATRLSPEVAALPAWSAVHGLSFLLIDGKVPLEEVDAATSLVLDTVLAGLRA